MILAPRDVEPVDVLLVCSTGGHLLELCALEDAWGSLDRLWITFDRPDAHAVLGSERVLFAHGPTNRSVKNLVRNMVLAWRVLRRARPSALVSTGAGVAVPFAWLARARGVRVVFVESLTRIEGPSLSGRLVAPVADRLYVQWPELLRSMRGSRFVGNIFSDR